MLPDFAWVPGLSPRARARLAGSFLSSSLSLSVLAGCARAADDERASFPLTVDPVDGGADADATAPRFLVQQGVGSEGEALAYYAEALGSGTALATYTLQDWQHDNFAASPLVRGYYRNAAELGFWRQMTCTATLGRGAGGCTVSNFTAEGGPLGGAPNAGTVAMNLTAAGVTHFWVFGPDGHLQPFAVLDSEGKKFVPRVCIVCHGGNAGATLPLDPRRRVPRVRNYRRSSTTAAASRAARPKRSGTRSTRPRAAPTRRCAPRAKAHRPASTPRRKRCSGTSRTCTRGSVNPRRMPRPQFVARLPRSDGSSPRRGTRSWTGRRSPAVWANVANRCIAWVATERMRSTWSDYTKFAFLRRTRERPEATPSSATSTPGAHADGSPFMPQAELHVAGRTARPTTSRRMPSTRAASRRRQVDRCRKRLAPRKSAARAPTSLPCDRKDQSVDHRPVRIPPVWIQDVLARDDHALEFSNRVRGTGASSLHSSEPPSRPPSSLPRHPSC